MANPIPIILSATPAPLGLVSQTFDELVQNVVKYMEASISESVSFFQQGPTDPNSDVGIFYNESALRFKDWSPSLGKYIPISELAVGDLKPSAVAGDVVAQGWIQLDGRSINIVGGINQAQKSVLETLYGIGANLPDYTFVSGLSGLPTNTSFSSITNPTITPSNGAISGLAIGVAYSDTEVKNLRGATEDLRDSTDTLQQAFTQSLVVSEKLLSTLNQVTTTGPKWKVFVGYQ